MPLLIGTAPNQVPTNADLGSMAFQDAESVNIKSGYVAGLPIMRVVVTGTSVTASAGQHLILTNASATTVTLPSTPTALDTIQITVANNRVDNVVSRNSKTIDGSANDLTIPSKNSSFTLTYVDDTIQWRTGNTGLNTPQKQVYSMGVATIFGSNYNSFDDFGQFLLAAYHSSGTAYVRVCKVNSDGTISTGTPQTFNMYNTNTNSLLVFMISETAGCIIYPNASNYPEIRNITINTSTMSVTIGNASSLGTNATFAGNSINGVKLTSQRLLVCYQPNGGVTKGYLGINLNTNGTLLNYYHNTGSTNNNETLYALDSTSAAVFGAGGQLLVTFSGSSAPTDSGNLNSSISLPYSKYYVNSNYYVTGTASSGIITNSITSARGTGTYTTTLPSYYNGFPGSALAYADDKVMIYNLQSSGGHNIGYYCPVSAFPQQPSFPYYIPTGENMQIQGNAHGHQLVGRQSVGMGKHGFAVDIGSSRYYILSPAAGSSLVYIYAYK